VVNERHPVDTLTLGPGVREALSDLRRCYELVFVTSRHDGLVGRTKKWCDTHFPGVEVRYGASAGWVVASGERPSKYEIACALGAVVHIDDDPGQLEGWPLPDLPSRIDNDPFPICLIQPWNEGVRQDIARLPWWTEECDGSDGIVDLLHAYSFDPRSSLLAL